MRPSGVVVFQQQKEGDDDTTLCAVSLRTVFGARAQAKRAYHRAVATRLVQRVILISAHDLIASQTSGSGERESGLFVCADRERDGGRYGERERKVERRMSGRRNVLSSRSTISPSRACKIYQVTEQTIGRYICAQVSPRARYSFMYPALVNCTKRTIR